MNSGVKRLWSYAAAGLLAFVTLLVFYTLRDFGPESTIRELNRTGFSIYSYVPPTTRFRVDLLRPADAIALARLTTFDPTHPGTEAVELANVMDGFVRPAVIAGVPSQIVRIDYRSADLAIVVTQYDFPGQNAPDFQVWIVRFDHGAWRIDVSRTWQTYLSLRPPQPTFSG